MADQENSNNWYGQTLEAKSEAVHDPYTGAPVIIRQFEFAYNADMLQKIRDKKVSIPTKQELFNAHWPQIKIMLWGDGLLAIEEDIFAPKVILGTKKYKIFLTCQPRKGVIVNDKIMSLEEVMGAGQAKDKHS